MAVQHTGSIISLSLPQSLDLERVRATFKVILLGRHGVGKTSIFFRAKTGEFNQRNDDKTPKFVADRFLKSYTLSNGDMILLDVWDTGGMEKVRGTLTSKYYQNAHLGLMVYDATQVKTFFQLREWIGETKVHSPNALFVLIGNKYDKSPEVLKDTADALVREFNMIGQFQISAMENNDDAVSKMFHTLASELYQRVSLKERGSRTFVDPQTLVQSRDEGRRCEDCKCFVCCRCS